MLVDKQRELETAHYRKREDGRGNQHSTQQFATTAATDRLSRDLGQRVVLTADSDASGNGRCLRSGKRGGALNGFRDLHSAASARQEYGAGKESLPRMASILSAASRIIAGSIWP